MLEASPCASAVLGACLLGSGVSFDFKLWVRCNYLFMAAHGSWTKMVYILQAIRSGPCGLDGHDATVALNITLQACAKAQAWEQALSMVPSFRRLQVLPSVATLGTVLAACERAGQWRVAVQLVDGSLAAGWECWEGVLPNVVCYNTVIAACRRARQWKHALQLLHDAHQRSLRPDTLSVATALRAVTSLKGHKWSNRAEELMVEMRRSRVVDASHTGDASLPDILTLLSHPEGSTLLSHVSWPLALLALDALCASLLPGTCAPHAARALAKSVNSALAALRRHRRWAEALHVVMVRQRHALDVDAVGLLEVVAVLQNCLQASGLHSVLPGLVKCAKQSKQTDGASRAGDVFDDAGATCSACDVLLGFGLSKTVQLALERRAGRPLLHSLRGLQLSSHPAQDLIASRSHSSLAKAEDVATAGLCITRELVECLRSHKKWPSTRFRNCLRAIFMQHVLRKCN